MTFLGKAKDDLVLEVVIFLGTAASDEDCAQLMCKADILLSLIELLKGITISRSLKMFQTDLMLDFVFLQLSRKTMKWSCK